MNRKVSRNEKYKYLNKKNVGPYKRGKHKRSNKYCPIG